MKSLRDEIRLRREKDGFNFICEADFIRATLEFHRTLRDFIENKILKCVTPFTSCVIIFVLSYNGLEVRNGLDVIMRFNTYTEVSIWPMLQTDVQQIPILKRLFALMPAGFLTPAATEIASKI